MANDLTLTLSEGSLTAAPSRQVALYESVPVIATGLVWTAGHSYLALLFVGDDEAGAVDTVTESVAAGTGVVTWSWTMPLTHAALITACTGRGCQATLCLWDATAERWAMRAPLFVAYAPEPTGFVASDPTVTPATAGQIATAVAAHNTSATAHADRFAAVALLSAEAPHALGAAASEGTATDASRHDHVHPFPTAANVGAPALATLTAAGSRYRATAAGTVAEQKCLVALAEAGAGAWAPALTAGAHHTVTRSGIWSGITPSGLEIGEGCTVTITGAFATTTTGITADATDALADITAASVLLVIWREASGYRAVCWEKA